MWLHHVIQQLLQQTYVKLFDFFYSLKQIEWHVRWVLPDANKTVLATKYVFFMYSFDSLTDL